MANAIETRKKTSLGGWLVLAALFTVGTALWAGGQTNPSDTLVPVDPEFSLPTLQVLGSAAQPVIQDEAGGHSAIVFRGYKNATLRGWTVRGDVAVELHDCEDITLIDCDLRRVVAGGCTNLRIVNCYIHDSKDEAVYLDDCTDVLVQGNRFERVKTGVLAHKSSEIRVVGNFCRNVLGPVPGGQLVQFDKVTGKGNTITHNYAINDKGKSSPEDMISLYQSHGTKDSPILVENNYLVGDPVHGSAGKSDSGSGIMLGDGGGSWQVCRDNTLISPGQVGIGVASGKDIVVLDNLILGEKSNVSNVGLYAWNQYQGEVVGQVSLRGNTVAWVNSAGQDNPYWDGGGFSKVSETGNTFGGSALLQQTSVPDPPSNAPQPPVPFKERDE